MEMWISVQQRFVLNALRELGCVRQDQLFVLTREKFRQRDFVISESRMETMLRQLKGHMGELRIENGVVKLAAAQPDALRLEAVDVMLELTGGAPVDFTARLSKPLLLQFVWGTAPNTVRPFLVAALPGPGAPGLMEQYRHARVIWLSGATLPEGLALLPKHFLAVRGEDGSHRFYGSNPP